MTAGKTGGANSGFFALHQHAYKNLQPLPGCRDPSPGISEECQRMPWVNREVTSFPTSD